MAKEGFVGEKQGKERDSAGRPQGGCAMRVRSERSVVLESGEVRLRGILGLPPGAKGIVLFAHGSGSGRLSPRNQFVAGKLNESGLATLLIDLLQESEEGDRSKVFDIDLLADRLLLATDWISRNDETKDLKIGYFGASTGTAAALQAAAKRGDQISAVVSRGGRPDLAMPYLPRVTAPTLLIVGGEDYPVITMNEDAYVLLRHEKEIVIVPGASHLFEEPGKLEEVARLAESWFKKHLEDE